MNDEETVFYVEAYKMRQKGYEKKYLEEILKKVYKDKKDSVYVAIKRVIEDT
jgi:hypothetical protein